ncbi:MAG TPA: sigma-70 family RNA polymerase sigma factor [Planctomycetaceae bacterium]|jgi:RNA polymerase sigma-70 factor (ECF subfamily)
MLSLLELIDRARRGDSAALGELLDKHRDQLRALAERDLSDRLRRRVDASDIVQQTFLIAQRCFEQFRGESDPELTAWLRQILSQNVQEAVRRNVQAQNRTVTQEVSLQSAGTTGLPFDAAGNDPTPSRLAVRSEAAAGLLAALDSLPDDQRQAVRLKHLDGRTIAEIALSLGKTEAAVAGLLRRGVVALRQKLHE